VIENDDIRYLISLITRKCSFIISRVFNLYIIFVSIYCHHFGTLCMKIYENCNQNGYLTTRVCPCHIFVPCKNVYLAKYTIYTAKKFNLQGNMCVCVCVCVCDAKSFIHPISRLTRIHFEYEQIILRCRCMR